MAKNGKWELESRVLRLLAQAESLGPLIFPSPLRQIEEFAERSMAIAS